MIKRYIYIRRYSQSNRKARSCKEYRFYTFTEISACFRLFKKVVRQNRQKWKGARKHGKADKGRFVVLLSAVRQKTTRS